MLAWRRGRQLHDLAFVQRRRQHIVRRVIAELAGAQIDDLLAAEQRDLDIAGFAAGDVHFLHRTNHRALVIDDPRSRDRG